MANYPVHLGEASEEKPQHDQEEAKEPNSESKISIEEVKVDIDEQTKDKGGVTI